VQNDHHFLSVARSIERHPLRVRYLRARRALAAIPCRPVRRTFRLSSASASRLIIQIQAVTGWRKCFIRRGRRAGNP
jgi:hypothetical protein